MATTWGYDKNTDYQKLIDEAVKRQNFPQAAMWEAMRNEKIIGEGLNLATTNLYSNYLQGSGSATDYQKELSSFKWDPETDPTAQAYKKQYMREADRTMEDVLGKYATMTGGLPSSQAITAASQAADNTKAEFSALLPQLEQNAYNRQQNQYSMQISNAMSRWQQLGYADQQVADILGVPVGTPTTDQSYLNWQKGQQDKSDAYNLAMTLIAAGQMPDTETLAAAGLTSSDAQALVQAYTPSPYIGSGSSASYSGTSSGKALKDAMSEALFDAYTTGNTEEYQRLMSLYRTQGYDVDSYDAKLRGLNADESGQPAGTQGPGGWNPGTQSNASNGSGLDESLFNNVMQTIRGAFYTNRDDTIMWVYNEYYPLMSERQQKQMEELLMMGGFSG